MSYSNVRPPRRFDNPPSLNADKKTRNSTSRKDHYMFKVLMLIVVVVGTVNIVIFGKYVDRPAIQVPYIRASNPLKDEQRKINNDVREVVAMEGKPKRVDEENVVNEPIRHTAGSTGKRDAGNKDRIIAILEKSGVEVTPGIASNLPSWSSVEAQYGSKPIILGLDTCETFQSTVPNADAFIAPAGMFNTGTNLMWSLLHQNCYLPEKVKKRGKNSTGMRAQVPWGKHNPATWRLKHVAKVGGSGVNQTAVFPVVMVKDPYHWMGSMCRHPYRASWEKSDSCPNLVGKGGTPNEVEVVYTLEGKSTKYESLVGLWNEYYRLYSEVSFPRLVIRYEDLLFYPDYIIPEVCKCAGGQLKNKELNYIEESAKGHPNSNDLLAAIMRYGDEAKRVEGFTNEDRCYAERALRQDLMEKYDYNINMLVGKMA